MDCSVLLICGILDEVANAKLDQGRCLALEAEERISDLPQGTPLTTVVGWVGFKAADMKGSAGFSFFQVQLSQQCRRI